MEQLTTSPSHQLRGPVEHRVLGVPRQGNLRTVQGQNSKQKTTEAHGSDALDMHYHTDGMHNYGNHNLGLLEINWPASQV